MIVKTLEHGANPDEDYQEDSNSFKIYELWSELELEFLEGEDPELDQPDEEGNNERSRRIAVAVEFSEVRGGYFFIERADPSPEWIKTAWNLLRENGWQGFSFKELRGNCRGVVKVLENENYTAVIDKAREKVFHNRGLPQGVGDMDRLDEFWDETERRPEGRVLETREGEVRIKLSNGEELWMEDKIGVSEDNVGAKAELTLEVCLGRRSTDETGEVTEELCIRSQEHSKFGCKLVGEVTGYDVEEEWPRAGSSRGYPLVELDAGIGKVVAPHENVPPVENKQCYHLKTTRWKIESGKLLLKGLDTI